MITERVAKRAISLVLIFFTVSSYVLPSAIAGGFFQVNIVVIDPCGSVTFGDVGTFTSGASVSVFLGAYQIRFNPRGNAQFVQWTFSGGVFVPNGQQYSNPSTAIVFGSGTLAAMATGCGTTTTSTFTPFTSTQTTTTPSTSTTQTTTTPSTTTSTTSSSSTTTPMTTTTSTETTVVTLTSSTSTTPSTTTSSVTTTQTSLVSTTSTVTCPGDPGCASTTTITTTTTPSTTTTSTTSTPSTSSTTGSTTSTLTTLLTTLTTLITTLTTVFTTSTTSTPSSSTSTTQSTTSTPSTSTFTTTTTILTTPSSSTSTTTTPSTSSTQSTSSTTTTTTLTSTFTPFTSTTSTSSTSSTTSTTSVCGPGTSGSFRQGTISWWTDGTYVYVIFSQSPGLNDNTYGTNAVGWSSGHTFSQLTGSDKAEFLFKNGAGTTVFDFYIDYLSSSSSFPSGYGSLGVTGGDGSISVGNAAHVSGIDGRFTSLDKNFNTYGYVLTANSPATDSSYTPNPSYPNWIFRDEYYVRVPLADFGSSGFGSVTVPSLHNSPAKTSSVACVPTTTATTTSSQYTSSSQTCTGICKGIASLTLKYAGILSTVPRIEISKGGMFNDGTTVKYNVAYGQQLTIIPTSGKSELGADTVLKIFDTGGKSVDISIPTSCAKDKPLDVGMVFNDSNSKYSMTVTSVTKIFDNHGIACTIVLPLSFGLAFGDAFEALSVIAVGLVVLIAGRGLFLFKRKNSTVLRPAHREHG